MTIHFSTFAQGEKVAFELFCHSKRELPLLYAPLSLNIMFSVHYNSTKINA